MGESIEFRWDRRRLATGAVAFAVIGALGVVMLLQPDWGMKALGLAWMAAFGYGAVHMLSLRADRQPVVTISATGLRDRRIKPTPISWAAIANFEEFEAENVPFVGLTFHDRKAALADARPLVRIFAPLHRLIGFPEVSISTALLDGTDAELVAAIARCTAAAQQKSAHL